jgi:uncharacterized membrane protein
LPGGNNANVFWMNNRGEASGVAENGTFDPSCSIVTPFQMHRFQPVIWGPGGQIERVLSPLQPDWVAYAFTINNSGEVVGASGRCSTTGLPPFSINNTTAAHAVLWDRDGQATDLGGLGGEVNIASSINNHGQVLGGGLSPVDGTFHAWLWTRPTGVVDYGAFPGAVATLTPCCHTINDRGEIVGLSIEPDNPYGGRALIWQDRQPKDLNDFVRDPGRFVHLLGAFSINDSGEIVCGGITNTGEVHACLAVPTPGKAGEIAALPKWHLDQPTSLPEKTRQLLRHRLRIRGR